MTWDEVLAAVDAQRDQLHLHIKIVDDSPEWLEQMTEMAEKLRVLHSILLDLSETLDCESCGRSFVIEKGHGPQPEGTVYCSDCSMSE